MEILTALFGEGKDLNTFQMGLRALLIFIITLILIRISGRRSFAMKSPFDNTIVILLGAVLSRAITGASPFIPTVFASLVIVILHRLFAWLSIKNRSFGKLVKGSKMILYANDQHIDKNMSKALVSKEDLAESVRLEIHKDDLREIETACMERNGQISVVKKDAGQIK